MPPPVDRRKKDANWIVANEQGQVYSTENASLAVLMDIRDEMKKLNNVFSCYNFQRIPRILDHISANTYKPKKKKKVAE